MMDYEAKLLGQIISLRNQKHTIMNHTAAKLADEKNPLEKHSVEKKGVANQPNKLNLSAGYSKDESEQIRIFNGQIEALTNKLKMLENFYFH